MKTINTDATSSTPEITYEEGDKLVIKGRSLPEDVNKFYKPMIDWAVELQVSSLIIDINLEYMNSASSKKVLELLKILDANNHIKELTINWFYEEGDEDTLENGQIYEELLLKASFRYHQINETL